MGDGILVVFYQLRGQAMLYIKVVASWDQRDSTRTKVALPAATQVSLQALYGLLAQPSASPELSQPDRVKNQIIKSDCF